MSEEPLLQSAFGKWFDDHYAAAVKAMEEQAAEAFGSLTPSGHWHEHTLNAEHNARKVSAIIEVPDELLMDYGLIPDTRPPRPPTPWRWRLRNRIAGWREQSARLAYRAIAGEWPDSGDDDW